MNNKKIVFMFSFVILFFTCLTNNYSQTENILLWNKLGDNTEAVNSEYGPNGTIYGTMNYYDAQFAKGAQPSGGFSGHYISYDATIIDPDSGCIEFWYQNFSHPQGPSQPGHEFHGMINSPFDGSKDENLGIHYGKYMGVTSYGVTFRFNQPSFIWRTINVNGQIPLGLHHIAVVWDRNGINGSSDYIRLYLDTLIVGTQATYNDWGTSSTGIIKVAVNRGTFNSSSTQCFAVDNLVVWNFAKTNFSDRFMEAPTVELAIEELKSTIFELDLPKGTENSLIKSLENALKSLDKGNDGAAINQLEAFINKVEAQRDKKLTEEEADDLIASVEIIITVIGASLEKSANNNFTTKADISPTEYTLAQNYPNPFNPTTNIAYQIPQTTFVTLKVYNSLGQEVAILVDEQQSTGTYDVEFKSSNLPSGLYIYKIQTGDFQESKKMILLK